MKEFKELKQILKIGDSLQISDICQSGCGKDRWEDIVVKLPNNNDILIEDNGKWEYIKEGE